MFLKKVKYKEITYYYLMRRVAGSEQQEQLASLGSITNESPYKEEDLIKCWMNALLVGGENKYQLDLRRRLDVKKSREKAFGKVFDQERILTELQNINKKYGYLSKQLLEKTARPNGELSIATSTLTNQLRNRGMSLTQLFEMAKTKRYT